MFADDTAIYFSSNNMVEIEDRLNSELASISNWIQANGLGLNVHKTEYMVIESHQKLKISQPIDLRLNDTPIARVESYKYLGVAIDTNLSWSTHTDVLSNKVSSRIGLLRRVRPYLTNFTATLVYNATIAPLFDYCDVIWDCCSASAASKLQRLQNRAARVILESDNTMPSEIARNELNWIPLTVRRQFHKAILMFKCLRKDTEGLDMNLVRHMNIHHYNTRGKEDFVPPKSRTNQLKRSFKYSAIETWNSLPPTQWQSESLSAFKHGCKTNSKTDQYF